jgi:hypothetical protein
MTMMGTHTATATYAPLAAYAARFATEHEFDGGTAELLGDLAGRFSFVCESASECYLSPDVLVADLRFLEHFLSGARHELQQKWGWSL